MGLNHIYFGSGKGKTTAALGLALRAVGSGLRVCIVQFLKSSDTSELHSLAFLNNVKVLRSSKEFGFSFTLNNDEKNQLAQCHNDLLRRAHELVLSESIDMLILDEFLDAYSLGLVDRNLADKVALCRYDNCELILTGRAPEQQYIDLYDYVSEISSVKHPFDHGITARKGIEY